MPAACFSCSIINKKKLIRLGKKLKIYVPCKFIRSHPDLLSVLTTVHKKTHIYEKKSTNPPVNQSKD